MAVARNDNVTVAAAAVVWVVTCSVRKRKTKEKKIGNDDDGRLLADV